MLVKATAGCVTFAAGIPLVLLAACTGHVATLALPSVAAIAGLLLSLIPVKARTANDRTGTP